MDDELKSYSKVWKMSSMHAYNLNNLENHVSLLEEKLNY